MLLDVFLEVQQTYCQSDTLKNWATLTYASPTDYWTFRKMVRNYFKIVKTIIFLYFKWNVNL